MPVATTKKTRRNPQGAGRRTHTTLQREEFLTELARYLRVGWDQGSCATMLNVSVSQVSRDVKLLRQRYEESQQESRKFLVAEQLEKLKDVRREAWTAWDRSKNDHDKQVEKFALPTKDGEETMAGSIELMERIVTKEGRLPDNAYLVTILKTFESERALLGLDEPTKSEATVHTFDWKPMTAKVVEADPVAEKIKALEAPDGDAGSTEAVQTETEAAGDGASGQ